MVAVVPIERQLLDSSIGFTPIEELFVRVAGTVHRVLLKLEGKNGGGGSIKARTVRSLLDQAMVSGELAAGGIVVESTSGNLGAALAIQAPLRGVKAILIADPKITHANLEKIRAAGAEVEIVDTPDANGGFLEARIARVAELVRELPGALWLDQYHSASNPAIHYWETGPEIVAAAPEADAIFVACSTGGTVAGIANRVRAAGVDAEVIPVDVPGSHALREGEGMRLLTGLGSALPSHFIGAEERARAEIVEDLEAIAACRMLESEAGISVGGSSGAALVGALRWLAGRREEKTVLVLCADGGENYDFGERALREIGVEGLPSLEHRLEDLAPAPGRTPHPNFSIAIHRNEGDQDASADRRQGRRCRQQEAGAGKGAERRSTRPAGTLL